MIGNDLGRFLHLDLSLLEGEDKRVGKILVKINIYKGLLFELEVDWRGNIFIQPLDYWGIPF